MRLRPERVRLRAERILLNRAFGWARTALLAAVAALLCSAGAAGAQTLRVATSPGSPPIANAVTRGLPSSVSFDVTNTRAGTRLRQLELRLPTGYTTTGGLGPPGWTVTRVGGSGLIRFQVASCALDGLASGTTGTFRVDATAPTAAISGDRTDALRNITPSDPCGGPTGWSVTTATTVTWARKALLVTGTVSPAEGAPPLAASATYTVTNRASGTQTGITLTRSVTPASGWTGGTCTPASFSLAAGASTNVICSYTLSTAGTYTFAATAAGASASAVGGVAGTARVGAATATFAFDNTAAGQGDRVRATLTVRNHGTTPFTATPPGYAQLGLQNLAAAPGTADPAAESVPAGGTADFAYALDVTGAVGSRYVAQGTASTTAGPTNLAVTPAGTVSASRVEWMPAAVVRTRTAAPYRFTVTVTNGSGAAVDEIRIVNPQNGLWTGMIDSGGSTLTYRGATPSGSTTYLRYTGTLAAGATATLRFQFTGVPAVTVTTSYPFHVEVYPTNGGQFFSTYAVTAAVAVPIPDVGQLSILSAADGQVLAWVNTGRADAPHDGVVVFRKLAPGVPTVPADFVDYSVPASRPADFYYADGEASTTDSLADPVTGAYNYRVCNRDRLFVYSSCSTGFWNGAGWLDSAVAPAGGWTHQLGGAVLLLPGVVPGNRVGVATNAPSLAVLDLATGDRTFDPVALSALPSSGTPATQIGDGRLLLFAADAGGMVTALDLGTGALAWQAAKAGESFVAGVGGITRQFAPPVLQAIYSQDLLLLGSTTGRLLAIDAATGATLWTVDTGVAAGVRARPWYDGTSNRLFVATNGGGVLAYDLGTSSPTLAPSLAAGYVNPGGTYRLACNRGLAAAEVTCVDASGTLRVLDKLSGTVLASVATGAASPSSFARAAGAAPGYVLTSASRVVRIVASGTPAVLSVAGQWVPGLTLSPSLTLSGEQAIFVGASDKRLHKLNLADASDTGVSVAITPQPASVLLGPPALDVVNDLFVFGTEDGRVWAVPLF